MSVLTITKTVPDRAFTIPDPPITNNTIVQSITANITNLAPPPTGIDRLAQHKEVSQTSRPAIANSHRHSRTISSSTLPVSPFNTSSPLPNRSSYSPASSNTPPTHTRKSSWGPPPANMNRQSTATTVSTASLPRRSTSGRSTITNSPSSYVARMRKQKATAWCDRSQSLEPRLAAQQKAAKQRAALEVMAANSSGRTASTLGSSGGVVGKIRHGGVPKAPYVAQNMSGASVPVRLLANEMLGDDEQEGRSLGDNSMAHARTGSGKSSINSGKYRSGYPRASGSPQGGGTPDQEGIPEAGETPGLEGKENHFDRSKDRSDSEDSFGEIREMTGPSAAQRQLEQKAKAEDLRRRGSVDERAHTITSSVRLYVANPDADSD